VIHQNPLAYLLGLEGVALLRAFAGDYDREFCQARVAEIRRLLDEPSLKDEWVTAERVSTVDGYRIWSRTYDQPGNGLFPVEEPVMHDIIDRLPIGTALDAACGTGRHTEYLATLGHDVIGVDSSPEMLERARVRVPRAEFRDGDLNRLPIPDDHVDLVVCALALSHIPDLTPAFTEFARVLRPGGHLVISDVHADLVALGSVVHVRSDEGEPGLLPAYRRRAGEYLAAAVPLGLQVRRCEEPGGADRPQVEQDPTVGPWDDWPWSLLGIAPAAAAAAWHRIPAVIVWDFELA
jgi:SAM-dependent methyltransferase